MVQYRMLINPHLEGDPFYWEAGPTGVLLSHGFTATTAEVRPLARFLHAHGYTVAGPLLPGHKAQPEDVNRFKWQDWAAAVEDKYSELAAHCKTIFVGGESTGAILALLLADRHPNIAGILTYAPALRLQMGFPITLLLRLLAPFKNWAAKPARNRPHNVSDDLWQGYPVNPLKGVTQLLALQKVVRARLPEIQQPLLVVQGRLDPSVHPKVPEILSTEIGSRYKEVHWMEKSYHCVAIDSEQDQVAEITLRFIERVLGGSAATPAY